MASGVLMPQAGISVESCIITEWLKQPGDTVAVGEVLFSYETDKASFECESTEAGTLLERFFENGDEVPVLTNVCAVGKPGEDCAALRPAGDGGAAAPAVTAAPAVSVAPVAAPTAAAPAQAEPSIPTGDLKISPRARHLAAAQRVDPRLAAGTGPYGRVIERDIRALMAGGVAATSAAFDAVAGAAPEAFAGTGIGGRVSVADTAAPAAVAAAFIPAADGPEYEDIAFSGIRKIIAKSMTQSLATIPQLTHNFSFNAAEILAYREKLKKNGETLGLSGVTLGDMVLFAVSRLLPKYPALNAHMLDANSIRYFKDVHLGVAVDTERGLMVPVIRHANRKSLAQISAELKDLAKQAQQGTLSPDYMAGGTFTVSNLGALAVESFTPVINPPQTGILGVDNIVKRPYEQDGQIKLYPAMGLSLTYDHRAIDGAPASRFVKELSSLLESFSLLLAQ